MELVAETRECVGREMEKKEGGLSRGGKKGVEKKKKPALGEGWQRGSRKEVGRDPYKSIPDGLAQLIPLFTNVVIA